MIELYLSKVTESSETETAGKGSGKTGGSNSGGSSGGSGELDEN